MTKGFAKKPWQAVGLALFLGLMISGCSSTNSAKKAEALHGAKGTMTPGSLYTVQKGDTLFGIAWKYGLEVDDLVRFNSLKNANIIYVGQKLYTQPRNNSYFTSKTERVSAPPVTSAGESGWIWPTRGKVVVGYSPTEPGRQGLRFAGQRGQNIVAVRSGTVAYTGTGLSGFGRMVIVQHENHILSAYGYLDNIKVKEGQKVSSRTTIGTMGIGVNNSPLLHFEIRVRGKPVNPYSYIGTTPRY